MKDAVGVLCLMTSRRGKPWQPTIILGAAVDCGSALTTPCANKYKNTPLAAWLYSGFQVKEL